MDEWVETDRFDMLKGELPKHSKNESDVSGESSEKKMTRNQKRKNDIISNVRNALNKINLNNFFNMNFLLFFLKRQTLINDLDPTTAILEKEHEEVSFKKLLFFITSWIDYIQIKILVD